MSLNEIICGVLSPYINLVVIFESILGGGFSLLGLSSLYSSLVLTSEFLNGLLGCTFGA